MKSSTVVILLGLGLLLLQVGCAPQQIESEDTYYKTSKTFNKEYAEVWKALGEIMEEELMYPIKIKNRERGVIETDWISVIRIRGTLRWNLRVLLDRKENGTEVKVYGRVEEPVEVRGKLKKKDKIKTGWQASEEKMADAVNLLKMLSARLEP